MQEYFQIKDICRQGLIKYLARACTKIPYQNHHKILDIGCGTGVPTLWLAENFHGNITAIDNDLQAINYLKYKAHEKKIHHRIRSICTSFEKFKLENGPYDLILAEGFLNVIGFENGFEKINELLEFKGYLVIHDEFKNHKNKLEYIRNKNYTIIDTLFLDEKNWWKDYYRQLDDEINKVGTEKLGKQFKNEVEEIKTYRNNPSSFQSIYYVLLKK